MQLPLKATSLTFTNSEPEDRLIVLASVPTRGKIGLLLTRRMTGRLINGLAGILDKSSVAAIHAPAEMRDDVILLEHQGAISDRDTHQQPLDTDPDTDAAQVAQHSTQIQTILIQSIDISVKPTLFEIVLKDGKLQPIVAIDIGRAELHRVLDTLTRKAAEAEWDIRIDAKWLEPGQTSMTLN